MYHSKPRDREGEQIEFIVPEAISSTDSRRYEAAREAAYRPQRSPSWVERLSESRAAFAIALGVALVEALIIILLLAAG